MTLERLKELQAAATPGPCVGSGAEILPSGDLRYYIDFPGIKTGSVAGSIALGESINALPALLEVAEAAWKALFVESKQMQDWTEEDIALYAALSQVMLDEGEAAHED